MIHRAAVVQTAALCVYIAAENLACIAPPDLLPCF